MEKLTRRRYTLEYKQAGGGAASVLWTEGGGCGEVAGHRRADAGELANWVKVDRVGQLRGVSSEQVSAERWRTTAFGRSWRG